MTNINVNRAENNAGALSASVSLEVGKQYCANLIRVILRHSQPTEVAGLILILENQANLLACKRYNPGLNDAKYDLYRRFWLKGGAV